jgi:hypothetical protein
MTPQAEAVRHYPEEVNAECNRNNILKVTLQAKVVVKPLATTLKKASCQIVETKFKSPTIDTACKM